jgi:hypothetical protein
MDYNARNEKQICEGVETVGGDIVLFHDDNDRTINAMKRLLPIWISEGIECKKLSDYLYASAKLGSE